MGAGRLLLSFSGIDGAGKTTQITAVQSWLAENGLRHETVRFWDDLALLGFARERLGFLLFKGEKGIGSADKPVRRRDKDVQTWYMTWARFALYFFDAISVIIRCGRILKCTQAEVVIFDRYIYDELANLDVSRPWNRLYARTLLRLVPAPDIAFLIDADPGRARVRKPEYPLEFLHRNRASFLKVAGLAGMIVIEAGEIEEVQRHILAEISRELRSHIGDEFPANCTTGMTS